MPQLPDSAAREGSKPVPGMPALAGFSHKTQFDQVFDVIGELSKGEDKMSKTMHICSIDHKSDGRDVMPDPSEQVAWLGDRVTALVNRVHELEAELATCRGELNAKQTDDSGVRSKRQP